MQAYRQSYQSSRSDNGDNVVVLSSRTKTKNVVDKLNRAWNYNEQQSTYRGNDGTRNLNEINIFALDSDEMQDAQ